MNNFDMSVLITQLIQLFLVMAVGYIAFKAKILNHTVCKHLSTFVLEITMPIMIIALPHPARGEKGLHFLKGHRSSPQKAVRRYVTGGAVCFSHHTTAGGICREKKQEQKGKPPRGEAGRFVQRDKKLTRRRWRGSLARGRPPPPPARF